MKVAIVCCAKMEENYIREFLLYYQKLGIDHIYIADNNDSNYKKQLNDIIKDFISSQFVTILNYNDKKRIQCKLYKEAYKNYSNLYDWIGFIDIDEYLTLENNMNIKEFLSQSKFDDFNSIVFPWVLYDDNDLLKNDYRPLNERFMHISDKQQNLVKSFYRTKFDITPSMHYGHDKNDKILQCDPDGNRNAIIQINEKTFLYNGNKFTKSYIKHFRYKTIEEFILKKIAAGRPCKNDNNYWLDNKSDDELIKMFFKFNKKTEEKESYGRELLKNLRNKYMNSILH